MFVWRACRNILHTLNNLKCKKIVTGDSCPICYNHSKIVSHVLWHCAAAKDVWSQSCTKIQKLVCDSKLFIDLWYVLTQKLNPKELVEAAVTKKLIWDRRNNFVHKRDFIHPNILFLQAKEDVRLFKQATLLPNPLTSAPIVPKLASIIWSKIPINVYKVNWDAACHFTLQKVGIRIIIRDCNGRVYATFQTCRCGLIAIFLLKLLLSCMLLILEGYWFLINCFRWGFSLSHQHSLQENKRLK